MKDLKDLKEICKARKGRAEFFIAIGGCGKSSKGITFDDPGWDIYHDMSDTWSEYKTDRGMLTNTKIGEALEKGALYWYGF